MTAILWWVQSKHMLGKSGLTWEYSFMQTAGQALRGLPGAAQEGKNSTGAAERPCSALHARKSQSRIMLCPGTTASTWAIFTQMPFASLQSNSLPYKYIPAWAGLRGLRLSSSCASVQFQRGAAPPCPQGAWEAAKGHSPVPGPRSSCQVNGTRHRGCWLRREAEAARASARALRAPHVQRGGRRELLALCRQARTFSIAPETNPPRRSLLALPGGLCPWGKGGGPEDTVGTLPASSSPLTLTSAGGCSQPCPSGLPGHLSISSHHWRPAEAPPLQEVYLT